MEQIKCVLFDLDGTVFDTSKGIINAVKDVSQKHGLAYRGDDKVKEFIGPPINDYFISVCGVTEGEAENLTKDFRVVYKSKHLCEADLYPGILNLFAKLKNEGMSLGVATFKRRDYANKIIKDFNLNKYFDAISGSSFRGQSTKEGIMISAMTKCGFAPANTVMVGDYTTDALASVLTGTRFIGVTYGFGFKSKEDVFCLKTNGVVKWTGAVGVAKSTDEIFDIIQEENGRIR